MLTKEQDDELEDIFKTVDGDGTGSIPFDKLADLVKACGSPMSETELRQEIGDSLITFKVCLRCGSRYPAAGPKTDQDVSSDNNAPAAIRSYRR